jgi:cation diffusion facilitator CzcD-associated flavoprotein CzcO
MTASSTPLSVAVIGAGPAGMFFCHALETYRREIEQKGDEAALVNLPVVTCFERAPAPGGVWRSERTFAASDKEETNVDNVPKSQSRPVETTNMCKCNVRDERLPTFSFSLALHSYRRGALVEWMQGTD